MMDVCGHMRLNDAMNIILMIRQIHRPWDSGCLGMHPDTRIIRLGFSANPRLSEYTHQQLHIDQNTREDIVKFPKYDLFVWRWHYFLSKQLQRTAAMRTKPYHCCICQSEWVREKDYVNHWDTKSHERDHAGIPHNR